MRRFSDAAAGRMPGAPLSNRARELMAVRFRALGEPMRLRILERLFRSPASVGEIVHTVGATQANISKHLAVLRTGRLVRGRKEGNRTVYSIADPALERLCAVVCEAVGREARAEAKAVAGAEIRRRRPA
jgi:DNA-binding transcriptional ArsR family regulator